MLEFAFQINLYRNYDPFFCFFIVVSVSRKISPLQNHMTPKCFPSLWVISEKH